MARPLTIRSQLPVGALVRFEPVQAPIVMTHIAGSRTVAVSSRVDGVTASEVIARVQPRLDELQASSTRLRSR